MGWVRDTMKRREKQAEREAEKMVRQAERAAERLQRIAMAKQHAQKQCEAMLGPGTTELLGKGGLGGMQPPPDWLGTTQLATTSKETVREIDKLVREVKDSQLYAAKLVTDKLEAIDERINEVTALLRVLIEKLEV